MSLSTVAKKAANDNLIQDAKTSCKSSWSVINGHKTRQIGMSCLSSLYEINNYFTDVVNEVIGISLKENDQMEVLESTPACESPTMTVYTGRIDPKQLIRVVKGLRLSIAPTILRHVRSAAQKGN